ncbi:MAG: DUF3800 domain-containing protein [Verrucomicrobiia bacterium]
MENATENARGFGTPIEEMRSFGRFTKLADWRFQHLNIVDAFFDESGHYADTDFICLAGYVAEDDGWLAFCKDWRERLRVNDIPYIHMKELMRPDGVYRGKGWSEAHRDDVLSEFITKIQAHTLAGFGIGFDAKYFRSLSTEDQEVLARDPHFFCFQRLMKRIVGQLLNWKYEASVSVWFDDHQKYSIECYKLWSALRVKHADMKSAIRSISFADDEYFYPLQGADILAWLSNRWLRDGRDLNKVSRHFREILNSSEKGYGFKFIDELWDKEAIDRALHELRALKASGKGKGTP